MSSFDTWLARITSVSQVIIMVLALLGFFYTVVPMYQNQLIEEQYARTRLANLEAKDKLRITESEINELAEVNAELVERRNVLEENIEEVSQELSEARKALSVTQSELSAQLVDLRSVRQELAGTKDSLEEIYLLRLAQAAEWMGIIGLPLDDCDRFAYPPDSARASDCTPYRYIDAALNWVLEADAKDSSGYPLKVPQEARRQFVQRARELLSEYRLQLNKKTGNKTEIEAVGWFFEQLLKKI